MSILSRLQRHRQVRIWHEPAGWAGHTYPIPDDSEWHVPAGKLAEFTVATLAGPEAEAQRIHQTVGGRLSRIRIRVEAQNEGPGGDFDRLAELLDRAGIGFEEANRAATAMVAEWWPQITRIAETLRTTGSMTGAEVSAVVRSAESTSGQSTTTHLRRLKEVKLA